MIATPSSERKIEERRVSARLQPAFRTICRLDRRDIDHPTIGLVWDLSETGVSMLLADPPKPGTDLTGELMPEDGGHGLQVRLRVIHVKPMTTGDYILGARFSSPLHADQMQAFLATAKTPTPWVPQRKG
jgi:PilZ domain-containing protein